MGGREGMECHALPHPLPAPTSLEAWAPRTAITLWGGSFWGAASFPKTHTDTHIWVLETRALIGLGHPPSVDKLWSCFRGPFWNPWGGAASCGVPPSLLGCPSRAVWA